MSSFVDQLASRVRRQIAVAHDPRNLVDETAGEILVGDPVLTTSGRPVLHGETGDVMYNSPPRVGWIPPLEGGLDEPETWQPVDHLYPQLRIKAHQGGWETPVALVYHLVKVQLPETPEPVVLRVLTIQFDFRGRMLPGQLKAIEHELQGMATGFCELYFDGMGNVGWSMDCGDPVPMVGTKGASAGNVVFRTPIMLRVVGTHNDPEGKAIVAAAQTADNSPTLT